MSNTPDFGTALYQSVMRQKDKIAKLPGEKQEFVFGKVFDRYIATRTGVKGNIRQQARDQFVNKMMGRPWKPVVRKEREPQAAPLAMSLPAEAGAALTRMPEKALNLATEATGGEYLRQKIVPTAPKLGTQLFGGPGKGVEESPELKKTREEHPILTKAAKIAGETVGYALGAKALPETVPGGLIAKVGERIAKGAAESMPFTEKKEDWARQTAWFAGLGFGLNALGKIFKRVPDMEASTTPEGTGVVSQKPGSVLGIELSQDQVFEAAEKQHAEGKPVNPDSVKARAAADAAPKGQSAKKRPATLKSAPVKKAKPQVIEKKGLTESARKSRIAEAESWLHDVEQERERLKLTPEEVAILQEKHGNVLKTAKEIKDEIRVKNRALKKQGKPTIGSGIKAPKTDMGT